MANVVGMIPVLLGSTRIPDKNIIKVNDVMIDLIYLIMFLKKKFKMTKMTKI